MLAPLTATNYQLRSTPAARSESPATPTEPKQAQENAKMAAQILDNLVSSPEFTKQAMKRVSKGDQLTIDVNGQPVLTIKSEGPSTAERVIKGVRLGITATAEAAASVVESDPAFSFRMAAMGVKTQVFNGIGQDVQDVAEKAFLPMMRGAALGLDVKKGIETFRNKDASVIDKIIEGTHMATDVVGMVGALSYNVLPMLKAQAGVLTAIGFAGDIVSYSYRALTFIGQQGAAPTSAAPPTSTMTANVVGQSNALKQAFGGH